ncbi:MAG: imidazolonepropionase [Anaerolineales bacterium]|nr:imidazolonepropionase [Anaerolineales bacterium]
MSALAADLPRPGADLLIVNAGEIITGVAAPDNPLGRQTGAALAAAGGVILAVAPEAELRRRFECASARVLDAAGRLVAPGFVDSHTHLVFGGSRVREYTAKFTRTPAEVRALGLPTGIQASLTMTRAASEAELLAGAAQRLGEMLAHGTTTAESKSGYGLNVPDELKMLRVNQRLRAVQPVDLVSTFLGAHDFPPELEPERYVDVVVHELLPRVAAEGLAEFCDVYCDAGYYTLDQMRRVLEAGRAAGLKLKAHVDQYAALGGAELAADLGVVSADHLNYTERPAMRRLAAAGVVGVLMPVIDWAVRHPRPFDARAMLDAGLTVALATDLCPGGWVESMFIVLQLAGRLHAFTPEEAFRAATAGGARALGLTDRGTLAAGQLADLQLWEAPTFEDIFYRIGYNPVRTVLKRGQIVFSR